MNSQNKMNTNPVTYSLTDPRRVIVGAVYVQNPRPWWVPVGLEETQGPNAKPSNYRPVSFAAEREWKDDDDGFQTFRTRRARRNARRKRVHDDSYDFDDSY